MANIGTLLHTFLFGKLVGEDEFGNKYYTERKATRDGTTRARRFSRWVVYQGAAEATKIPAYWHGWIHHTTDEVPHKGGAITYDWQEQSTPNATGTTHAYLPPGHIMRGGHHTPTVSDYEAWDPNN